MSNPNVKFNLPFTLGLPDAAPDAKSPEVKAVLEITYNAFQQIQLALHNYSGIGQQLQQIWDALTVSDTLHRASPNRVYLPATEVLIYGGAVNIFDNAGVLSIRNANATNNTRPTHGICTTSGGIAIGARGEVICNFGLLEGVAGLTQGTRYFLSTSDGLLTAVKPVAAGNIGQAIGIGLASSILLFNFGFQFEQF